MNRESGVVVVGAGGHALVSIEVLRACGYDVAGCLSADGTASADIGALGVSMLSADGDASLLVEQGHGRWFVAIGDNAARSRAANAVLAAGGELVTAVSPQAVVSPSALIGAGALVMPGAVVNALTTIGTGAIVNTGAAIDHECTIGEFAHVAPRTALAGRVRVGSRSLVGIGSSVIPGVRIGDDVVVGAGAAVIDDVAAATTVVGVPARPVRSGAPVGIADDTADDPGDDPRVGSERSDDAPVPNVLIVCTGNLCRSPLAEALLRRSLEQAGITADVSSAGTDAPLGHVPDDKLLRVADDLDVGDVVRNHRSRPIDPDSLASADLVLTMTSEQLDHIDRLAPGFDRVVNLRAAAWRAKVMAGRRVAFDEWARRLTTDLADGGSNGRDPSDDVADPMGGWFRMYRRMGAEVDELVTTLVTHWSGR